MNILIDYGGHSDLFYTMHLLFEKRLGYKLFFPIGQDWVDKGYVTGHYNLASTEAVNDEIIDGIHIFHRKMEPANGFFDMRGVTFDQFLKMDWDIIATTTYYQEKPFYELVKDCKPNALFLRQIANIREKSLGYCKNLLLGAAYNPVDYAGNQHPQQSFILNGKNHFIYIPEQYEGYHYTEPTNNKLIVCLARHISPEDLFAWNQCKKVFEPLGFTFKMYGGQYQPYEVDEKYGETISHPLLPAGIKESTFVWYTKPHGGGGFTVRQALACGRPVIIRKRYSSIHTIIECELFKHGINCIDLDFENNDFALLKQWIDPVVYKEVSKNTAQVFQNDTKFAETAEQIRNWLITLPRGVV